MPEHGDHTHIPKKEQQVEWKNSERGGGWVRVVGYGGKRGIPESIDRVSNKSGQQREENIAIGSSPKIRSTPTQTPSSRRSDRTPHYPLLGLVIHCRVSRD